MPPTHDVLLVIPCFRESGRLGTFLEPLCREVERVRGVSVLVVDDGSGTEEESRTRTLVDEIRARHAHVKPMLALPENLGKGGTVYAGWCQHVGERWLMFVDADGSVPASEVARIITLARAEDHVMRAYFASRVRMLGRKVERVWHRDVMGHIFHGLVNLMLGLHAHDTQCGCKLVPAAAFEKARDSLTLTGFAFDLDLLLALQESGCEVVEVPVDWHEVPGGKIHLLRDSARMLGDVMAIRRARRSGLQPR